MSDGSRAGLEKYLLRDGTGDAERNWGVTGLAGAGVGSLGGVLGVVVVGTRHDWWSRVMRSAALMSVDVIAWAGSFLNLSRMTSGVPGMLHFGFRVRRGGSGSCCCGGG